MPSVTINERDYTIYNVQNDSNNIVYVPGFAITGPSDRPILLSSYKELVEVFGSKPPETYSPSSATNATYELATSWEYAAGLLHAGFLVLFRRLLPASADSSDMDGLDVYRASMTVSDNARDTGAGSGNKLFTIKERYGGIFGNNLQLKIKLNVAKTKYFYELTDITNRYNPVILEYNEICEYKENDISYLLDFSKKLESAFGKSEYLKIEISGDIDAYIKTSLGITEITASTLNGAINKRADCNIDSAFMNKKNSDGNRVDSVFILGSGSTEISCITYTTAKNFDINSAIASKKPTLAELICNALEELDDKIEYDVKFITTGGISSDLSDDSNNDVKRKAISLCSSRGDCMAILDPMFGQADKEVAAEFADYGSSSDTSYAAVYAPWCIMTIFNGYKRWVAPSYVFLYSLAKSVASGNPSYLPPAGVIRASVPEVSDSEYPVSSALLDEWQNKDKQHNINPIMKLGRYGYVIYGQRTLYDVSDAVTSYRSALQEVGVRLSIIEIKKKIYDVATGLTFEYNNIHTWNAFKAGVEPLLREMKDDGSIRDYQVVMDMTTMTYDDIDDNTIRGTVKIIPGRAAEDFVITFELYRSSVKFENELETNGY